MQQHTLPYESGIQRKRSILRPILRSVAEFWVGGVSRGKRYLAVFLIGWAAVAALLYLVQKADEVQLGFNRKARLILDFLKQESRHEEGPKLIEALEGHRELLVRAQKVMERRQNALPFRVLRTKVDFENKLKEAQSALETNPLGDEDAAGRAIRAAATALERASKSLMVAKVRETDLSVATPSQDEFVAQFRYDLAQFNSAANVFSSDLNFDNAEKACFKSRFCAVSAVLAWPELAAVPRGTEDLTEFRNVLAKVRDDTVKCAETWPAQNEANHMKRYAESQTRRIGVVDALLRQDITGAEDALAVLAKN